MRRKLSKILSMLTVMSMIFSLLPGMTLVAGAEESGGTLVVEIETKKADKGDTVLIAVNATSNPGFNATAFEITFSGEILTLTNIIPELEIDQGHSKDERGVLDRLGNFTQNVAGGLVAASGSSDTTRTGALFWLEFKVKDTAADNSYSDISIRVKENKPENMKNEKLEIVGLSVTAGRITINPKLSGLVTAEDVTETYDGTPRGITVSAPGTSTVRYSETAGNYTLTASPTLTNVGSKTVYYQVTDADYTDSPFSGSATITITPVTMSVTAAAVTAAYDGKQHSITVSGAPAGSTVTYSTAENGTYTAAHPACVNAGTHTVWYKVTNPNYTEVKSSATVTINKAEMTGVTAANVQAEYNGKQHSITVSGYPADSTVTYSTAENGDYTAAHPTCVTLGDYTVWYKVTNPNYSDFKGSATVRIVEKMMTVTSKGYTGVYNGRPQGITVTVTDPAGGYTIKYGESAGNCNSNDPLTLTNADTKTVYFEVSAANYDTYKGSETITITEAAINVTAYGYTAMYDGEGHGITVTANPAATVKYRTTASGGYDLDENPSFENAGTYMVYYQVTKENYRTVTGSAVVQITPKSMTVNAKGFTGVYDGGEKTIDIELPAEVSDATVKYSTDEGKTYTTSTHPVCKNAGEYTIYYQVTKENYRTVTGSAKIIINKAAMTGITAQDINVQHNGSNHKVTVAGQPYGSGTMYGTVSGNYELSDSPGFSAVGRHPVYYKITNDNYSDFTGVAYVNITTNPPISGVTATGYTGDYTGDSRRITVNLPGDPPENTKITYSENGTAYREENYEYTNAGTYVVYYKVSADSYDDFLGSATVVINKVTRPEPPTIATGEFTLSGTALTGTIGTSLGSAVTYKFTSSDTRVVSVNNQGVLTARTNGVAYITVEAVEPASSNYKNTVWTNGVKVISAVTPITGVSASAAKPNSKVSANLNGTTLNVTGIAEDSDTVTVTYSTFDGGVGVSSFTISTDEIKNNTYSKTLTVAGVNFTVNKNGLTVLPVVVDEKTELTLKEEKETGAEGIEDTTSKNQAAAALESSSVNNLGAAAAQNLLNNNNFKQELATKVENIRNTSNDDAKVEINFFAKIEAKSYNESAADSFKLDITPDYKVTVSSTGGSEEFTSDNFTANIEIAAPVEIVLQLPSGLASRWKSGEEVFVKHTPGTGPVELIKPETWEDSNGNVFARFYLTSFSPVELIVDTQSVNVVYHMNDGSEISASYSSVNENDNLLTDSKSGNSFDGWQTDADDTAYKTVKALLAKYNDGRTITLTAKFTASGGTNDNGSSTGGGGGGGGGSSTSAAAEKTLTKESVTAEAVSSSVSEKAEAAAETLAKEKAASSGAVITQAGTAVTVKVSSGNPTLAALNLPSSTDIKNITTMAVLNDDGTLTPVPTKINGNTVTVLISGTVTLVPLEVSVVFNDTAEHWGQAEIKRAASLLIVEGIGNGEFNPDAMVTNAESVTMFMRAFGIMADGKSKGAAGIDQSKWYAVNMNTAIELGLVGTAIKADTPMSRIETAALIVTTLKEIGFDCTVSADEITTLLAPFKDTAGLGAAQREQLAACVKLGIFLGDGNGNMSPGGELQRAQMATLAVRIQDLVLKT